MRLPKLGTARTVHRNPFYRVYRRTADFGAIQKTYFVNEYNPRAAMLVARKGQVLLVRQYRLLINGLSWELPGGAVDRGETPRKAAIRECLEETGMRCIDPRLLLFFHPGLDTVYSPTFVYHSRRFIPKPESLRTIEVDGPQWVPFKKATRMIFERKIVDSLTIAGLLASRRLGALS